MGIKHVAIFVALLIFVASASTQEYSIRANRGLNLRAAPSLNAEIAGTVSSGDILLVVGHTGEWLKINRGGRGVWLADWVNFSRVEQSPSRAGTAPADVDNCCFVDRQCASDQEWTDGYWAYQQGQCAAPAQTPAETSAQPAASETGVVDNCCFTGWQCNSDQEWVNGYWAYQNNQCDAPPSASRGSAGNADSCCQLGWNCAFDFDYIMGRWWYAGNGGECNQPLQELVDGVIIEGSAAFISENRRAMQMLKSRAPQWHAYTTNIIRKIRESQSKPGYGTLQKSFNLPIWRSVDYAAAIIVHETCHVHRAYAGVHTTEIENTAEEAICDQVAIEAIQQFSPGTYYPRGRINDFLSLGLNWDIGPSVQRELDRARHIYAQAN